MQKHPDFSVYTNEMTYDIDKLLVDYCQHIRKRMINIKPCINYYILAKYLEGITTASENIMVSGMMARGYTIYELIRDSRMEIL